MPDILLKELKAENARLRKELSEMQLQAEGLIALIEMKEEQLAAAQLDAARWKQVPVWCHHNWVNFIQLRADIEAAMKGE